MLNNSEVAPCECEHTAHTPGGETKDGEQIHTCHRYMDTFPREKLVVVPTIYGDYKMCRDCASHIQQWPQFLRKEAK